jgi:hypothetical protein
MSYYALCSNIILLLLQHSLDGRKKQKKSRKNVKMKMIIKDRQFFPTESKQDIRTPVRNAARSITKEVKPNCMLLPNTSNKMQNVEKKKIKNKRGDKQNLSHTKKKSQSFDGETKIYNSEVSDAHLRSQRKRKWPLSYDIGSVHCRNKRKKVNTVCSQDDPLLSVSKISNKPTHSENKELTKTNERKQSKKKRRKIINSRSECVSERFEKPVLTVKSPHNINKLKQILATSHAKEELYKESISEKKQVKETGSLRERMLKRLQASHFR